MPRPISDDDAQALVRVLSMAENSPIWNDPAYQRDEFADMVDGNYDAIQKVRAFLKENGIVTLHEVTQRLAAQQGLAATGNLH